MLHWRGQHLLLKARSLANAMGYFNGFFQGDLVAWRVIYYVYSF